VTIYILSLRGVPVAAAWRFERLNERVADHTREERAQLAILPVEILT
jgi:hypothetical protein